MKPKPPNPHPPPEDESADPVGDGFSDAELARRLSMPAPGRDPVAGPAHDERSQARRVPQPGHPHQPMETAMPRSQWSAKRERQYDHIKSGLLDRGKSTDEAEEIAARTVNKVRAQEGESKEASATSIDDLSPSRRGGLRSHKGALGRTHRQLYQEARSQGIAGRSKMNKDQLERALAR